MKDLTTTEKLAIMREISGALPADPEIESVDVKYGFSMIRFRWEKKNFVVVGSHITAKPSISVAGHKIVIMEDVEFKPKNNNPADDIVKTQLCHLIDRCIMLRQDVDLTVI